MTTRGCGCRRSALQSGGLARKSERTGKTDCGCGCGHAARSHRGLVPTLQVAQEPKHRMPVRRTKPNKRSVVEHMRSEATRLERVAKRTLTLSQAGVQVATRSRTRSPRTGRVDLTPPLLQHPQTLQRFPKTVWDITPNKEDQACCPQLVVEHQLSPALALSQRDSAHGRTGLTPVVSISSKALDIDLLDGDAYPQAFGGTCRLRLYREQIGVTELKGLDWFDITIPSCFEPSISKTDAIQALWARSLAPWTTGEFFTEADTALSFISQPSETRRGLFFENGYYRSAVGWAAALSRGHIDVLDKAPDETKKRTACKLEELKERVGRVSISLNPPVDEVERSFLGCGPWNIHLAQDTTGYAFPKVSYPRSNNYRGYAVWPTNRIVFCQGMQMHACLVDYYLWWAWRLYSYGIQQRNETALIRAQLCSRVAMGELAELAYMVVHELGHLTGSSYGHCTDAVQRPAYCCTQYFGYLIRSYLESLEAAMPTRVRFRSELDSAGPSPGVDFAWELREDLAFTKELSGKGSCRIEEGGAGFSGELYRRDMMTPGSTAQFQTLLVGRCFKNKGDTDEKTIQLFD